jgi:hypothetical protein
MTLQDLLDRALEQQWFAPSYRGPLQSYVKRYASALGMEAKHCLPEWYHQPADRIGEIIYQAADPDLQPRSLQACVNTLVKLLAAAVEAGCLPPLNQLPQRKSLHRIYRAGIYLGQYHPDAIKEFGPPRKHTRYGLTDWPIELAHETAAYLLWCTPEMQRGRSKKIRKVESSQTYTIQAIGYIAGYAVTHQGIEKDHLTLRALCEPSLLEAFAWWWLQERRGVSTTSITKILGVLKTIARHWYKDEPLAQEIVQIFRRLDEEAPPQGIRDKEGRTLSLEELDRIARAYHPLTEEKLKEDVYARYVLRLIKQEQPMPRSYLEKRPDRGGIRSFKYMTLWFQMSLILKLLIHRPLRIGNICDLQFRHLQPQPGGGYDLVIPKGEMKNGKFMDRKEWRERFPSRLLPLFDDWLKVWRPRLLRSDGKDQDYIFLNAWGLQHAVPKLSNNFTLMTLRMTQDRQGGPIAWFPHLIRTTWTREMLNAGLNPLVVRRIMGDSFQVIEKHYGGYEQDRPSPFALQLAREIEQRSD